MFEISKEPKYWKMVVKQGFITIPKHGPDADRYRELYGDAVDTTVGWTMIVDNLIKELEERPGCKRMSYDTWHWTSNDELQRFLTYFYLKYPQDKWSPLLDNSQDY